MKTFILALFTTLGFSLHAQRKNPVTAIINVTVIDATGTAAQPNMTIVIEENRIADIAKSTTIKIPLGAKRIDGKGKFAIPGLWDMHVHLFNSSPGRASKTFYFPAFLTHGVTGVREMWTKTDSMPKILHWKKQFYEAPGTLPRIGEVGTMVDGNPAVNAGSDTLSGGSGAAAYVRKVKASGADFIKVYSNLSPETYFALVSESKKQGIPFAGHVPLKITAMEATNAGQRTIEHMTDMYPSVSSEEQQLRTSRPDPAAPWEYLRRIVNTYDEQKAIALFKTFVQNNTWHVPTLVQLNRILFTGEELLANENLKNVPDEIKDWWKPFADKAVKRRPEAQQVQELRWKYILNMIRQMHDAGVKIMAGTDLGNEYIYPGYSLHQELKFFVEAGLTPLQALQTATKNPAEFLNMSDSLGSLKKGFLADIVLLDADPLTDITNISKVNAIVLNGKYIRVGDLQKK